MKQWGGGVKKGFTLVEGGSKSFGGLRRGVKKFDGKNFQLPSPPPKYLWTLPKRIKLFHNNES